VWCYTFSQGIVVLPLVTRAVFPVLLSFYHVSLQTRGQEFIAEPRLGGSVDLCHASVMSLFVTSVCRSPRCRSLFHTAVNGHCNANIPSCFHVPSVRYRLCEACDCVGVVRAAFFLSAVSHIDGHFLFYQVPLNAYGLLKTQLCWFSVLAH